MEQVVCYCLKCNTELGTFKNSFNGIGSTYFSPLYPAVTQTDGFVTTGEAYQAATGSRVENTVLQDLACSGCKTVLGIRCHSAPSGHLLKRHQLLLRLAYMSVISAQTQSTAALSVQARFALTLPGTKKSLTPRREPSEQPVTGSSHTYITNGKKNVDSLMLPPVDGVLSQDKTQRDLNKFKTWAEAAIALQRQDIDRIGSAVDRIEKGMKSFRDFMNELRTDIAIVQQESLADEDLMDVRRDLNGFRDELATYKQKQDHINSRMSAPDISAHEFNQISRNVQKVQHKVCEVDALKVELEYLKLRLNSLENAALPHAGASQEDEHVNDAISRHIEVEVAVQADKSEETISGALLLPAHSTEERLRIVDLDNYETSAWRKENYPSDSRRELVVAVRQIPNSSSPSREDGGQKVPDSQDSDSTQNLDTHTPERLITPKDPLLVRDNDLKLKIGERSHSVAAATPIEHPLSATQVWSYTGSTHKQTLAKVCQLFGITHTKMSKPEMIGQIEKVVNGNGLLHSDDAQKYGTIAIAATCRGANEDIEKMPQHHTQNPAGAATSAGPKRELSAQRKREHSPLENVSQKRRKRASEPPFVDAADTESIKKQALSPKFVESTSNSILEPVPSIEPQKQVSQSPSPTKTAVRKSRISDQSRQSLKHRNSNGYKLTVSGKIDKRSFRYKPMPSELLGTTPAKDPYAVIEAAGPIVVASSISTAKSQPRSSMTEKGTSFRVVLPKFRTPDPTTLSRVMPFRCGVCGMGFDIGKDFRRHKRFSACMHTEFDEVPSEYEEEKRKQKLAERERLVVQALKDDLG